MKIILTTLRNLLQEALGDSVAFSLIEDGHGWTITVPTATGKAFECLSWNVEEVVYRTHHETPVQAYFYAAEWIRRAELTFPKANRLKLAELSRLCQQLEAPLEHGFEGGHRERANTANGKEAMVTELLRLWLKVGPSLRLGQLIDNAMQGQSIFYTEDLELLEALRRFGTAYAPTEPPVAPPSPADSPSP